MITELNLKDIIRADENAIDCSDGEYNIGLPIISEFGYAYNPAIGDVMVIGDDTKYIIGGVDNTDFDLAPGEVMLYSRSADGNDVKATIKLCSDGRIILNKNFIITASGELETA